MREVKQHSSLKRDAAMSVCTLGHTLLSCSTYRLTQHVEPVNFRTQKVHTVFLRPLFPIEINKGHGGERNWFCVDLLWSTRLTGNGVRKTML